MQFGQSRCRGFSMTTAELRPLSFGELLDRTFSYYRKHFWVFVGIMAIPQIFNVAQTLAVSAMSRLGPEGPWLAVFALAFGLTALIYLLASFLAYAALVFAVSEIHLGGTITIRAAYQRTRARLGSLFNLGFSMFLRIFGCAITIILLPVAVLMLFWYTLAWHALLLENIGARQAFKRSRLLTRGQVGRIFLIFILMAIVTWAAILVLQGPFLAAGLLMTSQEIEVPYWLDVLSNITAGLATALTGPLAGIALVLLYYDVRVRKEGYDLQLMMEALPGGVQPEIVPAHTIPELPKTSVLLMVFLTVITLGIYVPFWFLTRRKAINRLDSSEELSLGMIVFTLLVWIGGMVLALAYPENLAVEAFTNIVPGIALLVVAFKVRSILQDHLSPPVTGPLSSTAALQSEVSFSGLITFFFSIFYLQYKINRLHERFGPTLSPDETPPAVAF